jgi:hypothetical protein
VNKDVFNPKVSFARETNAKSFLKDGDKTTITLTFDRNIGTAPTVTISPAQGTLGAVTPVAGSSTRFTVDYTAPAGFTGAVTVRSAGAVSSGAAPLGGLTQVAATTTINVDNTAPQQVGSISGLTSAAGTVRVGRGGSTSITVTFNEAMSAAAANTLKLSIVGQQGLDDIVDAPMTLAANGLSASYLYLWKDSSNPFDNTHGAVTVSITGGKDLAGNDFGGTSGTFVNDAGNVVADAISPTGFISGVANQPTATVAAGYDLGVQLRWSIAQTGFASGSVSGTWFWVALSWRDGNADGDLDDVEDAPVRPGQATRSVTGLSNPVYNGFNLSAAALSGRVAAQGSTTSSGTNFTPFTPNGKFDVYLYFVSSTGNVSAISAAPLTITMQ